MKDKTKGLLQWAGWLIVAIITIVQLFVRIPLWLLLPLLAVSGICTTAVFIDFMKKRRK